MTPHGSGTTPQGPEPAPMPSWLEALPERAHAQSEGAYFRRFAAQSGHDHRSSAVLILFGPGVDGGEDVVLTQRTAHLRSHAGQVSFPGGRIDPGDNGPVDAALREAWEEVGLDRSGVRVLGGFPELLLAPSNSAVTPVLAWWEQPGPIHARSTQEVERVARVPLAELLDPANRFTAVHPGGYRGPGFDVSGLFVWGFTAMLLTATLDLAGLDPADWDRGAERDVPFQGVRAARAAPRPRGDHA